ncbi:glycosyltransferase [Amphibacillus jilinensis]|uniref:glycosyltransferase n=1 Tax=Amphibacillus jilinensis TaxID=1216008 RepID=UPI00031F7D2D|nr:glycosyltransferase [Amphibacillus jilinensis]
MGDKQPIKVIFINHTAVVGGAERSLLDILSYINKGLFHPLLVCFEDGELVRLARQIKGIEVSIIKFPDEILKYNRDQKNRFRFFYGFSLFFPIVKLWRFGLRHKVDLYYTNSMKAHFIGLIVGKLMFKKVIWHVRDILDDGLNRTLFTYLARYTDKIICISAAASKQFKQNHKLKIVYNGICPHEEANKIEC